MAQAAEAGTITHPVTPARPRDVLLPSWLLVPGVAALLTSLACVLQINRLLPALNDPDIVVYQQAGAAFMDGRSVYELMFADGVWPYTYPPVTLLLFGPMSQLGPHRMLLAMNTLSFIGLLVCVWLSLGLARVRAGAGRIGATAAISAAAIWLDPVLTNLEIGQVNLLLMTLVLIDLALPDRRMFKGVFIGTATAFKITPGIFIVYLLVTRRWRAAGVAAGTFLGLGAVGFLADPHGSDLYWLGGLFANPSRVTQDMPVAVFTQSLLPMAQRLVPDFGTPIYVVLALAVGLGGFLLCRLAWERGDELLAVGICGITGLLVSPVSWHYHWTFVVPVLVFLVLLTARLRGVAQHLAAAVSVGVFLVYFAWPMSGPVPGSVAPRGLVWQPRNLSIGPHTVMSESFTLAGLALLGLAAWWLLRHPASRPPAAED